MKAIALYFGGIYETQQIAIAPDGREFFRYNRKTAYGYSMSKWKFTGMVRDVNNLPDHIQSGFASLRRGHAKSAIINDSAYFNKNGEPSVRLPNV